ncbi:hypothetical protein GNI_055420 [Gregarina niphandrodes]|uniref:ABC1 atypical kinase-like domain-containing protein n=1 Tax=Gregarina niphandrodes TaxID=110365 RepID=A0A023B8X5_GRENI|nr:hypothetical protein GNI_055420 [Gregarina niphandrodes]EZG70507.1 hypothetical protein GNI_055420 [Gregarina niphandrodes]|eukprot:XP_011129927.1 hypothetical protein GNI_055420 [Gregarina niphandrodes]
MLLWDNYVHCDLHPGNLLVRVRRQWMTRRPLFDLVLLDAGLTSSLTERDRLNFIQLFRALTFGEGYEAGRLLVERALKQDCKDPHAFCTEVADVVSRLVGPRIKPFEVMLDTGNFLQSYSPFGHRLGKKLLTEAFVNKTGSNKTLANKTLANKTLANKVFANKVFASIFRSRLGSKLGSKLVLPNRQLRSRFKLHDMNAGRALREILSVCVRHRVQLEPQFLGVVLALGIVEGIGNQLDPELDLLAVSRPFLHVIAKDALWKKDPGGG